MSWPSVCIFGSRLESCPEAVSLFGISQKVVCFSVQSTTRWDIMEKKRYKIQLKRKQFKRDGRQHMWLWKPFWIIYILVSLLWNFFKVVKFLKWISDISLNAGIKVRGRTSAICCEKFWNIENLTKNSSRNRKSKCWNSKERYYFLAFHRINGRSVQNFANNEGESYEILDRRGCKNSSGKIWAYSDK